MTSKLVLVVDDDEDVRDSICDVLATAGHSSVGAADGRAALELLHARRFDVIVTDPSQVSAGRHDLSHQAGTLSGSSGEKQAYRLDARM
jgi:DNA-binding NtrC family response regulator